MRLKGMTAIITGGGTGIGKGVSERLAREGANVSIVGINVINSKDNQYDSRDIGGYTAAKKLAKAIVNDGYQAIAIEADITNEDQVKNMIDETVTQFGAVDILVNCAGIVSFRKIENLTVQDWDHVMDVNLKGTYIVDKAAIVQMRKQGSKGKIINFSSDCGKKGEPGLAHYCASKWGVIGFTKALSKELAKENITVNSVCPGIVGTQMWKSLSKILSKPVETEEESYKRNIEVSIPQGVPQTAEDMAEAVVFLSVSDHITGEALSVDGGSAT